MHLDQKIKKELAPYLRNFVVEFMPERQTILGVLFKEKETFAEETMRFGEFMLETHERGLRREFYSKSLYGVNILGRDIIRFEVRGVIVP